ncbi:MAG: pilus assembly protein PilM [Kiritimatiellae bacterium]|nr:pilus assembly protein PilM [Kiritimatiellia bacterium]MDD5521276.1 pilus assembly protein PilM [Kiritimatiellia bacterium]
MAKELITGVRLTEKVLEWSSIEKTKDHLQPADSGIVTVDVQASPNGEEPVLPQAGISDLIAKNTKHLHGNITLGLSSEQLLMRVVKLPVIQDQEELKGMVQLQVDKLSPFPVENMVVSHEIMDKGNDFCLVLIAAVKNEIVDTIGKLLTSAGIFPARVDANVLGWCQLFKDAEKIPKTGRQIMVIMAETVPEIIVFQNGIPVVFRSLNEQGPLTDEEFAGEIAHETAYTMMSLEMEYGGSDHCGISIWHRGNAPAFLEDSIRRECHCELNLNSLESLPHVSEGLARRTANGGQLLDLTPDTWRSADIEKLFRHRMLITAGVLAGIWALSVILFVGGLFYQQKKLASLKSEFEVTQKPAKEVMDMRRRVNIIRRYSDRTYSSLECLREIVSIQPEGVDLNSYEYKRSSGPATVTINGQAATVAMVYEFKNSLDASKLFMKGTIKGPFDQKGKQAFQIDMKLPIGGEE